MRLAKALRTRGIMVNSRSYIPVRIAFIGGGSLNWAPELMASLAYDTRLEAEVRLYDTDFPAAERNAAIGARYAEVSRGCAASYLPCPTIEAALTGADVVVISILPGRFEDMGHDLSIPASYGIPQAVGDTVGPGGIVRAIRAIPMLADIATSIRDVAPDAYVCNLTNPMSALTGALYATFPQIKAWGECHEVTKIRRMVASIANEAEGTDAYSFRDVEVNVLGINHFTFADRITLRGRDMLPAYRAFVAGQGAKGWHQTEPDADAEHRKYFGTRNLVAFDLLRRFGLPAAAGDRHLAEFLPVADYLADPARWGFALTPIDYRIRDRAAKLEHAEALKMGRIAPHVKPSNESLIEQITALKGGGVFMDNVNLPNRGQVGGLPSGAIVESNAVFSGLGIAPVPAGKLPVALEDIVAPHAQRQSALVPAVLNGDRPALFALFHQDPLVALLPTKTAKDMFNQMLAATDHWLPENLKGAA